METKQAQKTDNQRLVRQYKQFLAKQQQKRLDVETPEREQRIEETIALLKQENAQRGTPIVTLHL
jgi:hypothetical protein